MIEQEHKMYYCKMEKTMRKFVQCTDNKKKWVCTNCPFTTTTPQPKPPKVDHYKQTYEEALERIKRNKLMIFRSS